MGEWIIGTIIRDYIGATIGSIAPFPSKHQGDEGNNYHEQMPMLFVHKERLLTRGRLAFLACGKGWVLPELA